MAYPSPVSGCSTSGLCNLTLGEASPMFQYTPIRDGPAQAGWNASYTGSTLYEPGVSGIGIPYRLTSLDRAAFQLSFDGTAIYLCLAMSTGATYTLTVDGQQYNTTAPPTDPACFGDVGVQTVAFADGLSQGSHSVVFTANLPGAGDALSFYGAVVTLDVAPDGYTISDPIYVDDANPGWSYLGGNWIPASGDPSNYNDTHTYNCVYNPATQATYTVPIGAAALILMGTPDVNTFAYSISLDGTISVYNSTNLFGQDGTVLYFASGLDPTREHTITATDFDANDETGQGVGVQQCLSIDALLIFNATAPASGTSTTMPSSTLSQSNVSPTLLPAATPDTTSSTQNGAQLSGGAVAGIVIGALLALLLLVLLAWLLRRRANARAASDRVGTAPEPYFVRNYQGVPSAVSASDGQAGASTSHSSRPSLSIVTSPPAKRPPVPLLSTQVPSAPQSQPTTVSDDTRDTALGPVVLEQASTFDLVQVLNRRLHNEQMDNIEEPPDYPEGSQTRISA